VTIHAGLASEIQKLAPSAVIELFVLDATSLGGDIMYFHAGTNELSQNITWQGQIYTRFPIAISGFEITGQGQFPRPKLRVSNVLSAITTLLIENNDLLGAKLTRKRTLAKYLDAINFTGSVNPTADSSAEFPEDIYFIDRKANEDRDTVEFELAAAVDMIGVMCPRRQIIQNICTWRYRGSECGYTGTNYFDQSDNPVATAGADTCGKRLSSCKARFGQYAELPFGSFPAADLAK
jgi:lambda family phage minor tail protein L